MRSENVRKTFQKTFSVTFLQSSHSLACLLLFGICWGAVPVTKNHVGRFNQSAISAAGPFSNLALALVAAVLLRIIPSDFLRIASYANCMLFVFNILPIPILDGWGILEPFVPPMRNLSQAKRSKYSNWAIFLLWVTPLSTIMTKIYSRLALALIP